MKTKDLQSLAGLAILLSLATPLARGQNAVTAEEHPDRSRIYRSDTSGGIAVSQDRGNSWRNLTPPHYGRAVARLIPDLLDEDLLYAVDQDGFLLRSTDGGMIWRGLGTSLPEPLNPSSPPAVAVSSEDPATLWFGGNSLWRLSLEDMAWEAVMRAPAGAVFTSVTVSPNDGSLVLAGDSLGRVVRLENGLDPVNTIQGTPLVVHPGRLLHLSFDADSNGRVIAAFAAPAGIGADGLLWLSEDSGLSWAPMDIQPAAAGEFERDSPRMATMAAATATNNCAPSISPGSFSLSGAAQEKTITISFRRAKNPSACHWQPYETTMGTLTIVNISRSAGLSGPGTVQFKITANHTNQTRKVQLYFDIRPTSSGPWTIKKTVNVSQKHL